MSVQATPVQPSREELLDVAAQSQGYDVGIPVGKALAESVLGPVVDALLSRYDIRYRVPAVAVAAASGKEKP